jgi:hypothetical protein
MTLQQQLYQGLIDRRMEHGDVDRGTGKSLAEYLAAAAVNYKAESKVADLITLQAFLLDRINSESELVTSYDSDTREASGAVVTPAAVNPSPTCALIASIIDGGQTVVKSIKAAFHHHNASLPPSGRLSPPKGSEIREMLRARCGAPAAVASGVAVPNADKWDMQKATLVELVEKRRGLLAQLEDAKANLLRIRGIEPENVAASQGDDALRSEMPGQEAPSADLSPSNFDRYGRHVSLQEFGLF